MQRVLPFQDGKDPEDEKHVVHPLQLDVIDRVIALRSNPGEVVSTPFMGVGSEVYAAVQQGRRGIGIELEGQLLAGRPCKLEAVDAQQSAPPPRRRCSMWSKRKRARWPRDRFRG